MLKHAILHTDFNLIFLTATLGFMHLLRFGYILMLFSLLYDKCIIDLTISFLGDVLTLCEQLFVLFDKWFSISRLFIHFAETNTLHFWPLIAT